MNNIFRDYYNYKVKTVFEYSILLSKIISIDKNKLGHRRKTIEDALKWIINNYFENSANSYVNKTNIIKCFISDKQVSKYNIDNELVSVINYFIENKKGFEIKEYEKEIIFIAVLIHIANSLDISTSPYKNNKNTYKTILSSYLEKYNKINYFMLIDEGKKNTNILLELIKTNVRKERRIFELLNSKISFNRYINVSNDNKYYIAQYNYSVPGITKLDSEATNYIYATENIDNRFVIISRDIIMITLMKLFSIRKLGKIFFLPTKKSFYKYEENIKELKRIYNDRILSKFIKILINYNDYSLELENILKVNKIDHYIYCSKNNAEINGENIRGNNYLLSKDFNELNKEYALLLEKNSKNIIYEDFKGTFIDNNLINESEDN